MHRSTLWLASVVAGLHLTAWLLLSHAVRHHPALSAMAFVAYALGLRHAFDVDHIAAIDNTVRKLTEQRRDPTSVGFFFALGHSTVVFAMALGTAFAARSLQSHLPAIRRIGALVGTSVSAVFLLGIGVLNLVLLKQCWQRFRRVRAGHETDDDASVTASGGLITRLLAPLWRVVTRAWHVYPVGVLFGLGFDTASEVALLALSASAASGALPWTGVLALPLCFAAGMTLFDTADGVLMTRAYRWAFVHPLGRVYYNLVVTALSVVAALGIGGLEGLQWIANAAGAQGPFWGAVRRVDLGHLGLVLVALFVVTWLISVVAWKCMHLDRASPNHSGDVAT